MTHTQDPHAIQHDPGGKLPLRKISPISNRKALFHARQNRPLQTTRHRFSKGNDAPAFTQMLATHSFSDMRLYEKEMYLSMLQTERPANNREQIARNRSLTSAVSFWGDIAEKPSSYLEDNGESR